MSSFFQPTYWLTMQPPEVGGLIGNIVFTVFVIVLVLGIVGRIVVDRKHSEHYAREIGNRISTLLVTMGILGVILFFFSFESIQLFGGRFWYPVWIIAIIVWSLSIARYVRRDIPLKKARAYRLATQGRYFPKKKKKRRR